MLTKGTLWRQRIKESLSSMQRQVIPKGSLKPAAVLVPIYEKMGEHYIVFTRRTQGVMYHKGQISFPGGAYDEKDGYLKVTALREAFEEVGIRAQDVEILGSLDDQATLTSSFVITPFVGATPYPYNFRVNRKEVEELIEAPVSALLNPACFIPETVDDKGKSHPWGSYRYGSHQIIGITARILKQFLDLISAME